MMPHPERVAEALLGGTDGLVIYQSMIDAAKLKAGIAV
jgi:phosphoribosylformylglycinamidine (FGAM) synthase-like amidotransferase family enzyme